MFLYTVWLILSQLQQGEKQTQIKFSTQQHLPDAHMDTVTLSRDIISDSFLFILFILFLSTAIWSEMDDNWSLSLQAQRVSQISLRSNTAELTCKQNGYLYQCWLGRSIYTQMQISHFYFSNQRRFFQTFAVGANTLTNHESCAERTSCPTLTTLTTKADKHNLRLSAPSLAWQTRQEVIKTTILNTTQSWSVGLVG